MTTQSRIFDDLGKLMTNAMGVAQGARNEAETALKGWVDRWLADRDFVTREEFEALREMAIRARAEAAELRVRLDRLDPPVAPEASGSALTPGAAPAAAASPGPAASPGTPEVPLAATAPGASPTPEAPIAAAVTPPAGDPPRV